IDANGDVVLAWNAVQGDKVSASYRPAATGVWEAPTPLAGEGAPRVAIRAGSAIVVANDDWTVRRKALAFPRPWGGAAETVATYVGDAGADPRVEYTGGGQAVVVYGDDSDRYVKASVRGAGTWSVSTVEDAAPNK